MKQNGNALFLILIAVALFAALSYAVTQSGRGGGNIDRETEEIALAQLMQEIGRVQNAFDRMALLGVPADQIEFCNSANVSGECSMVGTGANSFCTSGTDCFFAPEGGGLTDLSGLPDSLHNPSRVNTWEFMKVNFANNALGHGTTAPDIMFENRGIEAEACEALHNKLDLALPLIQDPGGGDRGGISGAYIHCYEWFNGSVWHPKIFIVLKAY